MTRLRLATRGSALALAQTEIAAAALAAVDAGITTETVVVRTSGDVQQKTPVAQMQGQGWFTAELERVLLEGAAEIAVHSGKDLPTDSDERLEISALLSRADPADVVITRDGRGLADLAAGARVGTSSVRRVSWIRVLRPDLQTVDIRGNVDTRLRKLDSGEVDALLLAGAGLQRLGLEHRIAERLDPQQFLPAPAQGIIALQCRTESPAAALVRGCDDAMARVAFTAERALLRALGGGCLLPLGAWARVEEGMLRMAAALDGEDGSIRRAEGSGALHEAQRLAEHLADRLR